MADSFQRKFLTTSTIARDSVLLSLKAFSFDICVCVIMYGIWKTIRIFSKSNVGFNQKPVMGHWCARFISPCLPIALFPIFAKLSRLSNLLSRKLLVIILDLEQITYEDLFPAPIHRKSICFYSWCWSCSPKTTNRKSQVRVRLVPTEVASKSVCIPWADISTTKVFLLLFVFIKYP